MRRGWKALGVLSAFCAVAGWNPALGQAELAKLLAPDGGLEDYFGHAAAISGTTAVVAMQYDDDSGENTGAVYVFQREDSQWTQQAKLTAADAGPSDLFGASVAIEGDTIVVGAPEDDDETFGPNSGSAYVFRFDGESWVQQGKLIAADAAADALFGKSVAISGDTVVIGTVGYDLTTEYAGSAYVFHSDGSKWTQQAKLFVDDGADADLFGLSVATDGDVALIAAPYDDEGGRESGSVYVFRRDGKEWTQEQKLIAADAEPRDYFGWSVAIDGETVLIGASRDDDRGEDSGSAYVFRHDGVSWVQQAKLTAPDGVTRDHFGAGVALDTGTAVIAAPDYRDHSGAAYVFLEADADWNYEQRIRPFGGGGTWDQFGSSVAVSGIFAVMGAQRDDDDAINRGSAYVFHTRACPGDLNGDGEIDLSDLAQLLANYRTTSGAAYEDGDLDGDGDVDLSDLAELLGRYHAGC